MRIQITGLEKAQDNAKAGINLVQTAEGALTEVHDMLNRMYDLAEQSANGTFDDTTDRKQLQKEIDSLRDEINRIADGTNYNGINLLDGSMEKKTVSAAVKDVTTDDTVFSIIQDGDPGQKAQAGVFSLELSDVKLSATQDDSEFKVEIFGQEVSLGTFQKGESIDGKSLVNKIVEVWNAKDENGESFATKDLDGSGTTMRASTSLDGKSVVFTMDNPPAADWETSSAVTFTADSVDIADAAGLEMKTEVEPVAMNLDRKYAQATFELTSDTVVNGKTVQIGDETYVFAVGRKDRKSVV